MTVYPRSTVSDNALLCMRQPSFLFDMVLQTLASIIADWLQDIWKVVLVTIEKTIVLPAVGDCRQVCG